MGTTDEPADEQIRVTSSVKEELNRRKREGERLVDVVARLLDDDRDLLAGYGAFKGTDRGEAMSDIHERGKAESRSRLERMIESRKN